MNQKPQALGYACGCCGQPIIHTGEVYQDRHLGWLDRECGLMVSAAIYELKQVGLHHCQEGPPERYHEHSR